MRARPTGVAGSFNAGPPRGDSSTREAPSRSRARAVSAAATNPTTDQSASVSFRPSSTKSARPSAVNASWLRNSRVRSTTVAAPAAPVPTPWSVMTRIAKSSPPIGMSSLTLERKNRAQIIRRPDR